MIEDTVQPDEMLLAMAHNLVETHNLYKVPEMEDPPIYVKDAIKPPKEVFYRKTMLFATKVPPPPRPRRCSCQFVCTGAAADIKCMTCSLYDVTGNGYYCQACFNLRHPWYRIPHIWSLIAQDESIEYQLSVQHRKAEAIRYAKEGTELLDRLHSYGKQLDYVGDDVKIDDELITAGRKAQGMEEQLIEMRHKLRDDLRFGYGHRHHKDKEDSKMIDNNGESKLNNDFDNSKVDFDDHEASVFLQRCYRGYMVRKSISLLFVERFYRVYDRHAGREYYHDQSRELSSWEPPRFLMQMHYELLQCVEDNSVIPYWACKRFAPRRRLNQLPITNHQTAGKIICTFFRCIIARKRIIKRGNEVYRRVWDDEHKQYFYANLLNGESVWVRPALFLLAEPPLHVDEIYQEIYHSARSAYSARGGSARDKHGLLSARSRLSARKGKGPQSARIPSGRHEKNPLRDIKSARK